MSYAEARVDAFADGTFRVGTVISRSLSIFANHIFLFALISGVVAIPDFVGTAADEIGEFKGYLGEGAGALTLMLAGVSLILFSIFSNAMILYGVIQHMKGEPIRIGEALGVSLRRFFPLLGVTLLSALGILAGAMLFVVPGAIVMSMWYVAIPVCVVERRSTIKSLDRSGFLTRGYRAKIFALAILGIGLSLLAAILIPKAVGEWLGNWGQIGAQVVLQSLSDAFGSVLIAVAYYYLRVAKEGVDVSQVASVFD